MSCPSALAINPISNSEDNLHTHWLFIASTPRHLYQAVALSILGNHSCSVVLFDLDSDSPGRRQATPVLTPYLPRRTQQTDPPSGYAGAPPHEIERIPAVSNHSTGSSPWISLPRSAHPASASVLPHVLHHPLAAAMKSSALLSRSSQPESAGRPGPPPEESG